MSIFRPALPALCGTIRMRTTTAYAACVLSDGSVSRTTSPARNVAKPCRLGTPAGVQARFERLEPSGASGG
eukprot:scaffold2742_cov130-Isochrysis_galbana.AAC.10